MKIVNQIGSFALLCAIAMANVTFVLAQEKEDEVINKITTFLNTSEELRNYAKNGYTSIFSGNFREIPDELQMELNANFPEHRFYIAKMKVLIDPPYSNYDLILVTDADTAEVEGFIWGNYWMIRPSESFEKILKGHQVKSEDEGISQVKTFAKLITFVNNDKVGDAKSQNGKVKVELIRGEGVFGVLEVEMNDCLQFNRITITEPNGEELKYFV